MSLGLGGGEGRGGSDQPELVIHMDQMLCNEYYHEKVPVYRMAYGTIAWFTFIVVKVAKLHNSNTINVFLET